MMTCGCRGVTVATVNAPDASASLTMMPMPARLAAAAAAAVPRPPLLLVRTGSAGGDEASVSAASLPLLAAVLSILRSKESRVEKLLGGKLELLLK